MRVPKHIGIIPDGNRRWAVSNGFQKDEGYKSGVHPGLQLFRLCEKAGVEEITFYGFTTDNAKRPKVQRVAFTEACVEAVEVLTRENASILVIGDTESHLFPEELKKYTKRSDFEEGKIKVNFLVNYGWKWDLNQLKEQGKKDKKILNHIKSNEISRVDLIIRWGGRRRLSGFLPVQSIYADFYVLDNMWPEFRESDFYEAIEWYQEQDITLGG